MFILFFTIRKDQDFPPQSDYGAVQVKHWTSLPSQFISLCKSRNIQCHYSSSTLNISPTDPLFPRLAKAHPGNTTTAMNARYSRNSTPTCSPTPSASSSNSFYGGKANLFPTLNGKPSWTFNRISTTSAHHPPKTPTA